MRDIKVKIIGNIKNIFQIDNNYVRLQRHIKVKSEYITNEWRIKE